MTSITVLYDAVKESWSRETSSLWSKENPALGQCGVTALVFQDHMGGEIFKTSVAGALHFYNSINGVRWDFTFSQFLVPIGYEDRLATRGEAFSDTTAEQYTCLSTDVKNRLAAKESGSEIDER
ncbi:YunG family protein [Agrobacterium rubi]|uniref:Uncharacterized protein n=1 Tax=Agrobacterium rubi TaxID=28099 RepID=A0AAE7R6L9_9HYPH|nr:hypothetical protein [Agrobacterium rubi]NTE86000.1 hypothetical protein [Agrobacterium rubi]NTF01931.1 hypothetical protein [Agrobacterium rubi]NTF36175.1 hypothetical protein [Agrobacterium rubi]OCJ54652.1 hypothetical protein A6U92_21680 [Agrobacterium rubi]QTG01258.1 hypothetical protein G6M88_13040 [Agrobacterium rubi]